MSLTAGLDSRVTLALLKLAIPEHISKIKFITYKNLNVGDFDADIEISKILSSYYELDHVLYDRNDYCNKNLIQKIKNITYYSGTGSVMSGINEILEKDYIHLRSNVYEIGRAFYQNKNYVRQIYKGNKNDNPGNKYFDHTSCYNSIYRFDLFIDKKTSICSKGTHRFINNVFKHIKCSKV